MSPNSRPCLQNGCEANPETDVAAELADLPKEVGVLLLVLGVFGLLLPGPIGTPALLAGGLVLWPGTFGRVSHWLEKRHPEFARAGNRQVHRFVSDLEHRYPSASDRMKQSTFHFANAKESGS